MAPRAPEKFGLSLAVLGAVGLGVVMAVLPFVGGEEVPTLTGQAPAYALILLPAGTLLYGLLVLSGSFTVPKLLLLGAATGSLGAAAVYFGGRPEALLEGPAPLPLTLLFVANLLRLSAAVCFGFALARRIISPGIALLVAGVAAAADLFSVFAGPTKTLVEESAPALDYLLLTFPTFGYSLGFALGVADFVFLALFTAIAHRLAGLHPLLTLVLACTAVLIAMLAGLLLGNRPLPALPFIALSFILANVVPLMRTLVTYK